MPTEKQNLKYINDLLFEQQARLDRAKTFLEANPYGDYAELIFTAQGASDALSYMLYFMETGKHHPDLLPPEEVVATTAEGEVIAETE
jgi:fructoselysine-6-P-deglycase FrlB-like protein